MILVIIDGGGCATHAPATSRAARPGFSVSIRLAPLQHFFRIPGPGSPFTVL